VAEVITDARESYFVLRYTKRARISRTRKKQKNGRTVRVRLKSKTTGQPLYKWINKMVYLESESDGERWDARSGEYRPRRKWGDTKNILLAHRFESVGEALKYSKIVGRSKQLLKWCYKLEVLEVVCTIRRTARRVYPLDVISALAEVGLSVLTEEMKEAEEAEVA